MAKSFRPSAFSLQPSAFRRRGGISLLEVLISMFVLAVGLLGVAALIPAGRHEIAQGARLDFASMIGRGAFRDMQVRGMLNPGNAASARWYDATPTAMWNTANPTAPFYLYSNPSAQVAYAIDPLGMSAILAAGGTDNKFPYTAPSEPYLTRIAPMNITLNGAQEFLDTIFRASVDLTTTENPTKNLPPIQQWFKDTVSPFNPLRRASEGNYSWLATIVSDPTKSALNSKVTVSVAVFHKRDLSVPGAGEYVADVSMPTAGGGGIGGGEVGMRNITSVAAQPLKPVRPGQWLMLAGRHDNGAGVFYDYFRWYRVVAAQELSGNSQDVTLAGPDWNTTYLVSNPSFTKAWIFDNVVAVYEKNLTLEY